MHRYIRFISLRKYGSTLVADAQLPPSHICRCSGGMNPPLLHTAAPNQRIETMIDVFVDQGIFASATALSALCSCCARSKHGRPSSIGMT